MKAAKGYAGAFCWCGVPAAGAVFVSVDLEGSSGELCGRVAVCGRHYDLSRWTAHASSVVVDLAVRTFPRKRGRSLRRFYAEAERAGQEVH